MKRYALRIHDLLAHKRHISYMKLTKAHICIFDIDIFVFFSNNALHSFLVYSQIYNRGIIKICDSSIFMVFVGSPSHAFIYSKRKQIIFTKQVILNLLLKRKPMHRLNTCNTKNKQKTHIPPRNLYYTNSNDSLISRNSIIIQIVVKDYEILNHFFKLDV